MGDPTIAADLPVGILRERSEAIASDLLFRKRVVAGALEPMRPGGAENPDAGASGWLTYLLHLTRLHATSAGSAPAGAKADTAELRDAIEQSLAATPELVMFDDGKLRGVYPKSYHALEALDQLDAMMRLVAQQMHAYADRDRKENVAVQVHGIGLRSRAVLLWLWILTHPEPGLPYEDAAVDPKPPKWTLRVTPEDIMRIAAAHLRVHAERLNIISSAFPPDPSTGTTRLPLVGFIGVMARDAGVDAATMTRRWSLGALMAQSVLGARAAKEAEERAKTKTSASHEA